MHSSPGPFRIKNTLSGLCWSVKEGDSYVRATSACKDLFVYKTNLSLVHYNTGIEIRSDGSYLRTGNYDNAAFIYGGSMQLLAGYIDGSCIIESGNLLSLTTNMPTQDLDCGSQHKILPGILNIYLSALIANAEVQC